ncbi:MAG: 3-dehydroquinate synthase [Gloeomargaritaceae cyanobacterium C42_A2020_066]|nr:3-dehydroquinate synthase [Gloeomargaritaceae cyanobacterium C42_A2020_066]
MTATTTLTVDLDERSYPIQIGAGLRSSVGNALRAAGRRGRVLLVSQPPVFSPYGAEVEASLRQAGFEVAVCLVPDGERFKTLKTVSKIYDAALDHRLERGSTVVALGGGVVGDMAGFAAATWLRGVAVVQVPTTLLAMVDAAIGGKTGVNHPKGKNLIGAFHQPRGVLIDPEVLATLRPREYRAGVAEVIKYGVIWDAGLFTAMEAAAHLKTYQRLDPGLLQTMLTHACQAKATIVSKDERESGLRALLNYGHTLGHALESLTHYRRYKHGEAVAVGMVAAGRLAVVLGWWSDAEAQRQEALIRKAGLPVAWPATVGVEDTLATLQWDKKVQAGRVRFVLPTAIGAAQVTDEVPADAIRAVIRGMRD